MATITIIANPAQIAEWSLGRAVSIEIMKYVYREKIEAKKVAETRAALEAADAKLKAEGQIGYQLNAFVFDGGGRKPAGFDAARAKGELTINNLVEPAKVTS